MSWVATPIPRGVILAIDPGPDKSGWCYFGDGRVQVSGISPNAEVRDLVRIGAADVLAVEMIASYGMAVGADVFKTCVEIGRFIETWRDPEAVRLVYRRDVKLHLCGSARAKDPNVRAALIDLLGPPGTKKNKGPTYGVASHAWSALAVAVVAEATAAGSAEDGGGGGAQKPSEDPVGAEEAP